MVDIEASRRGPPRTDAARGNGGRKPRVKAEVVAAMAYRILSGSLEPGQYLPTEADLCQEYGVSRTVVREATKVLESKGLLSIRSRVGMQILERDSWNLIDPDMIAWSANFPGCPEYLASWMEARRIIEPEAAALAAERASPAEVVAMEEAIARMSAALNVDMELFIKADADFHNLVLAASKNHVVIQLGKAIHLALLTMFRRDINKITDIKNLLEQHRQVALAIKARDSERAYRISKDLVSPRSQN